MQTNLILSRPTAASIDSKIDRLLKDLGNPKPPVSLETVRRLLKLDIAYYSATDTTWLKDKIHQLKVAGKQILSEPSTIVAVTKSLGLKGILFVERRRILLDKDFAAPKLRWNEAHEITHDVLPWHGGISHGDPEALLSFSCHELIEAEANYGAGRLLFCGNTFTETVRSSELSFDSVKVLHKDYGNSMTTTLWRVIESTHLVSFGFIGAHPRELTGDLTSDIRYFLRSPSFSETFAKVDIASTFHGIYSQCRGRRGPIGSGELVVCDDRNDINVFRFDTFWNGHDALTIAVKK